METRGADRTMDENCNSQSGPKLIVSIVLYCPDRALLGVTLRSLGKALDRARHEGLGAAEVILTDHSRQAQTALSLDEWRRDLGETTELIYVHDGTNPGFGAGHNAAFYRSANADFFLVANPDLEFAPCSLTAGLGFLAAHPRIGLVAPALIEAGGAVRPACFGYPDLRTLALRAMGFGRAHPRVANYECRGWDVRTINYNPPLLSGCCLLFRAEAFALLNGFDPAYFLYFEDFDLSLRASRFDLTAYVPAMQVMHAGGGAARKGWRHRVYYLRSALRFFNTHGWRW